MLTWWLFYVYITCALLYIDFCYHVCLHLFAYVCLYFFCMTVCCMITLFSFMMHIWLLCSFAILTCWLHQLILLLACFNIRLFLLYDYLALLDMYILIFIYLIHIGMIDSLYCILSCLSEHIVYSCYIPISCLACVYI